MTQLKLFYAPGACSLAPHIVLEETGAAYEPVRVALAKGEQRTPEYLRINPKGRVPALTEGDWALTENPAILRYLARRLPRRGCGRTPRVRRRAAPSGSPGSPRRSTSPTPTCAARSGTRAMRRRSRTWSPREGKPAATCGARSTPSSDRDRGRSAKPTRSPTPIS